MKEGSFHFQRAASFSSRPKDQPSQQHKLNISKDSQDQEQSRHIYHDFVSHNYRRQIFQLIGKEKNGLIQRAALAGFLSTAGVIATQPQVDEMLTICSPDGCVQFEQFQALVDSLVRVECQLQPALEPGFATPGKKSQILSIVLSSEKDENKNVVQQTVKSWDFHSSDLKLANKQQQPRQTSFRSQKQLDLFREKCAAYFQVNLNLQTLVQLVEHIGKQEAACQLWLLIPSAVKLIKKVLPLRMQELEQFLSCFKDQHGKVELKEVLSCLLGVSGVTAVSKLRLGLKLYPERIHYSELVALIERLSFCAGGRAIRRVSLAFKKKGLAARMSHQQVIDTFVNSNLTF